MSHGSRASKPLQAMLHVVLISGIIFGSVPSFAFRTNISFWQKASAALLSLLAGDDSGPGFADGVGTSARFKWPYQTAVDSSGNIYIADSGNNTIRKMTSAGVVTTLAGTAGVTGSADGSGAVASFNTPSGVAVDGTGNVYVADTNNHPFVK
jgi:hypothetical protein